MTLSIRTKESIKTALAMTIAYGIALSQDWDTPMWAGFAIIFISQPSSGASFNKSAMRILGTLVAGAASLILIALFPQDRWLFIFALSIYVGFCTYMMGIAKHQYFWYVCGYVSFIVALEGGPNSAHAFDIAILRVQENGLGIIVYSVVAALLWRNSSVDKFNAIVVQLHSTQHQLYRSYFSLMNGQGKPAKAKKLMAQEVKQQTQFKVLLLAAETDSYEIGGIQRQWRLYQSQICELNTIMERWYDSFVTIPELKLQRLILNLTEFDNELEQRFVQIKYLLEGNSPAHTPQAIELKLNETKLSQLSHFQKAALLTIQTNLRELEQISHALFNSIADIKGFSQEDVPGAISQPQSLTTNFAFDLDSIANAAQVMATVWFAFLIYIYVEGLPGGIGLVIMAGVIAMRSTMTPNLRISSMIMPFMYGVLLSGVLYTFIMPQLTSFIGLGIMIFLTAYFICYLYAKPQQALSRTAGLVVFVILTDINNEQSYNILSVYNTALMLAEVFGLLLITSYIPFSPRPEQAFTRLLSRFFHSSEYLMSTLATEQQRPLSFWERRRKDFYLQDLKTLPNKIESRSKFVNTEVLLGTSKEHIDAITTNLQMINIRILALLEARTSPQAQILIDELLTDSQIWRISLQDAFQHLSKKPVIENQASFYTQLTDITEHLESRIKTIFDNIEDKHLSRMDKENFYRLLGAYHGVSQALLEYSANANLIDWAEWSEVRF